MKKTTQIEATFKDTVKEARTYGIPAVCVGDFTKDDNEDLDLMVCGNYPQATLTESILDLLIQTIDAMKGNVGEGKEIEFQTKILDLFLSWVLHDDEERITRVTLTIDKALDDLINQPSDAAVSPFTTEWKDKYRKN